LAMVHPLDQNALLEVQELNPTLTVRPILCDAGHFDEVCHCLFGGNAADMNAQLLDRLSVPKAAPQKPAAQSKPSLIERPPEVTGDPTDAMDAAPQDILGSSSPDLAGAM